MAIYERTHNDFQLGDDTLRGLVASGLGPIAVGVSALYENGFVPGETFDAKKLKACGVSDHLTKVIIKQCQGLGFNKHRRKGTKIQKPGRLSTDEQSRLEQLIEWMAEDPKRVNSLRLIFQGMTRDQVPAKFQKLYQNFCNQRLFDFTPPDLSIVKELFSEPVRKKGIEILEIAEKRGKGKPGASPRLPDPDSLRQLVGVRKHNDEQNWSNGTLGKRTTKDLSDALHLEWFRGQVAVTSEIKISIAELCYIQGDSPNTIRARNKRNGIKKKENFFKHPVTSTDVEALLLRCRGGCWWELEFPEHTIMGNFGFSAIKQVAKRYPVSEGALRSARKAWERAGRPSTFIECLRIGGFDVNSYELPTNENLLDDNSQNKDMPYIPLMKMELKRYDAETVPF